MATAMARERDSNIPAALKGNRCLSFQRCEKRTTQPIRSFGLRVEYVFFIDAANAKAIGSVPVCIE